MRCDLFDSHSRRGERTEQGLGNVDAHNPHFIGRVAELRRLRENLAKPGTLGVLAAVHGLGGMGKTALVVEYAHAFAHEYGGGRWQLGCQGKEDLRAAVAELATPLGVDFTEAEKLDVDLQFQRVLAELRRLAEAREPHRCLLILDSVDRPELLEPAQTERLPAADWLHVIATTRLGEGDLSGAHKGRVFLAVDELPEADALQLIESYQPGGGFRSDAEREGAREIVRLLGGFPLAVESAAVCLGQFAADVTCGAFLARLRTEGLEGLDAAALQATERVLHGERRLSATLQPTLERLGEREKLALRYAALLPPDRVALPWLRALVAREFPELSRAAEPGCSDPWRGVLLPRLLGLRLLQGTGVVDADGQPLVARIHRLVQELVRRELAPGELAARQDAVRELMEERDAALRETTHWPEARWELEPLDALAWLWAETSHPRAAWLLNQVAQWWHYLAEWTRAEPLMRRALALDEQCFGPDHPDVARDLNNLALLLQNTNRLAEAEPLMRRAAALWETGLGPDHPSVATALNNLAQLLQATNRLAEAEPLMRRTLAMCERCFGPDHPEVATRLNNLAQLLQATNRLSEAEPLMRRALAVDEQSFGPDHPTVAIRLNNLAQLLQATNCLSEAEPLMRRALAIDEQSFGPDHPEVARDLNNLALLLQATNRLSEAEPLHRRALAIDEASFGPDHPNVATRLNNLAHLLQATNRLAEAEPLMRRVADILGKSLGPDHPNVATALNNLARLLQATNRLAEAEPLMRRALAIDEASLGPDHPDVARDLNNLAQMLQDTDRLSEAEPLMRRALAIDEASLGPDHPKVAIRLNNLGQLLQATGRLAEAEPLYRRALAIDEAAFGPDHPDVAIDLNSLGQVLQATNRLAEAEPLVRRVVEIFAKSFGPGHPNVASALHNLAQLLQATNRLAEAEPLMRRVVEIIFRFRAATGHGHPHERAFIATYAGVLAQMGRSGEDVLAQLNAVGAPFGIRFGD
jgi:tetratricopeptide (TPR) repeat protein